MSITTITASYKGKTVKLRADWDCVTSTVEMWQNGEWESTRAPASYKGSGARVAWLVFLLADSAIWTDREKCHEHVSGILNGSIIEVRHDDRSIRLKGNWSGVVASVDYGEWEETDHPRCAGDHDLLARLWLDDAMTHYWTDDENGIDWTDELQGVLDAWCLDNG